MASPVNPFASPAKITAVSLKLLPSEADPLQNFAKATGMSKAELWALIIHTAIAAIDGDAKTLKSVQDYVAALKADAAKKT